MTNKIISSIKNPWCQKIDTRDSYLLFGYMVWSLECEGKVFSLPFISAASSS
jgi:hypothetical protein